MVHTVWRQHETLDGTRRVQHCTIMRPNTLVRLWSLGSVLTKAGAGCRTWEQQVPSQGLGLWQLAAHSFKSVPFIDRSFLDGPAADAEHASRANASDAQPSPRPDQGRRPDTERGDRRPGVKTPSPRSGHRSSMDRNPGALPFNHRITSNIKSCKSLTELLEIIRKDGVYFNPPNISASMRQLVAVNQGSGSSLQQPEQQDPDPAKEAALPTQPDNTTQLVLLHAALILLARLAQHQIQAFEPRQLGICSWGAAKLVSSGAIKAYSAAPITSIMMEHACSQHALRDARPADLSALAWSAYIMRDHDERLLGTLATSILDIPPAEYQDYEIINILMLFAAAKACPPRLFSTFCAHLVASGRLEGMLARHVQQLAFACASAKHVDAALVSGIARRAEQVLVKYKTMELCGLVSSLSALKWRNADIFRKACSRVEAALRDGEAVEPRHIAQLLFQQSIASLTDDQHRDRRLVRSSRLMEAALPALMRFSTLNETCMATAILTAEVLHGNQAAVQGLMGTLAAITPQLARMRHESFELQKDLLLGLVHSLKHIAASLQQRHAAAAEEPSSDSQQAGQGAVSEGLASRIEHKIVAAFAAELRSVAVARLSSMNAEERAVIASTLVAAADAVALPQATRL